MKVDESHWNEALERIAHEGVLLGERTAADRGGPPRDLTRSDRELPCMLRLDDGQGSFVVHRSMTRNSGRGGVSLLHTARLEVGEPATLAMQTEDGRGFVAPANVAWCRRIGRVGDHDEVVYEVGFRFTVPLATAA